MNARTRAGLPPYWSEGLLRWCLGRSTHAAAVLGDLREQYRCENDRRGARAADRWYRRQLTDIGFAALWERTAGRRLWERRWSALRPASDPGAFDPRAPRPTRRGASPSGDGAVREALQDVRLGLRLIVRQPLFSSIAIATLALGIGVNVTLFSTVKTVLYSDLPYAEPARLVQTWSSNLERDVPRWGMSLHDFEDLRAQNESLADLGVYNGRTSNLTSGQAAERVRYALVSPSLMTILGIAPALGRTFRESENLPGADNVVLLSHDFWQNALGAPADVLDRTVQLDGRQLQVVGVMPPGFWFPGPTTQLWKPFGMRPDDSGDRSGRWVSAVGRLREGVSLEQAQQELSAIAASLAAEYPETNSGFGAFVEPRHAFVVRNARSVLGATWGIAGMILLIACVNVANLLLARATSRSREMAIRASLGAGRGRLIRQTLSESIVLALVGGGLGVLAAAASAGWVRQLENTGLPRLAEVRVDAAVLLYALMVSLATGLLFGLAPALRGASHKLAETLRQGAVTGGSRGRTREALVVCEIALAAIVLVGAGLLARSFWQLHQVPLGFETTGRLSARVTPSWAEIPDRDQAMVLFDQVVQRLRSTPGVRAAAMTNLLPLAGTSAWGTGVSVVGRPDPERAADRPGALYRTVSDGYFEVLGIPLLHGRFVRADDRAESPHVVVLSESLAKVLWPDDGGLGERVHFLPSDHPAYREYEVVGIVADVQDTTVEAAPGSVLYVPHTQANWGYFQDWGTSLVVEVDALSGAQVDSVVSVIREEMPGIPVHEVESLEDRFAGALAVSRFNLRLLLSFALLALTLASIGIYGVVAAMVGQRMREIGTRIALGADARRIVALIVRRGLALAAIGAAAGTVGAVLLGAWLQSLVFQTSTTDPATLVGVAAFLLAIAVAACLVPARRATRIDPIECLRRE